LGVRNIPYIFLVLLTADKIICCLFVIWLRLTAVSINVSYRVNYRILQYVDNITDGGPCQIW